MEGYEVNFLNPEEITFFRSTGGLLQAVVANGDVFNATLFRTFPHSFSFEYISVRNEKSEEIGIIRHLDELSESSKSVALSELKLRYLIPVVTQINKVKNEGDLWLMDIETDRGKMGLVVQWPHDAITNTARGGMVITDLEGRRCEIREVSALDKKSYRELMRMI